MWAPAFAADFSADITDFALLTNPAGGESPRALLSFALPEDFSGKAVRSAKLFLPVSIAIGDTGMADLAVWPVGTAWTPGNVTWSSPWSQPGGDVVDSSYALYSTSDGTSRVVEIDISTIASAWAQGWYSNHGLLVTLIQSDRYTLQVEQNGDWPSGVVARIEIVYEE
jgi:hypothetical protein